MIFLFITLTLMNVGAPIRGKLTNTTTNDYQNEDIFDYEFENYTYDEFNFTNSSSLSSSDSEPEVSTNYKELATMIFYIVIMCVGVIGNVMVALVILLSKDMRNSTNIFLLNLSIADLLVLLVRTPVALLEIYSESWMLGKEMCFIERFIRMTVTHASVFSILALSFERYYAICKPFKAGYVCTNTRAVIICALVWFFAALTTSPLFGIITFKYKHNDDGTDVAVCASYTEPFWNKLFFIMSITVIFFIPLGILIVIYSIIAKNLIENTAFMARNSNNTQNSSNVLKYRKQVTLMLGAVVLSFFVCLLPVEGLLFSVLISPIKTVMFFGIDNYYSFLFFAKIMLFLHSAINPILYNLMSSKFRQGFVKLLRINKLKCSSSSNEHMKSQETLHSTTSIELCNSKDHTDA